MYFLLFSLVLGLKNRGQPLVTITIDAPTNNTSLASGDFIHVTPVETASNSTAEVMTDGGEQVIRIEVVNKEDWWSSESQLHFPKELGVRILLGFLVLTFFSGLFISVLMIIRWWHLHHPKESNFHRLIA
jgi:hypothetical protein